MTARRIGSIFLIGVLVVCVAPAVSAEIYLKRTDTGTIKLTDDPIDDTYRLILKSEIPEDYEMPSVEELKGFVTAASEKHDIPKTLIYAVIKIESDGEKKARSHEGAMGLMQLMPATAEQLGVEEPMKPRPNIMGGAKYLKNMLNRFDGDLTRSLAAYNAGPGNVAKYDGIPPFEETERFVKRVQAAFEQFRRESDMIYTYYDDRGVLHVTNIH
jgi:hypothetical protein